MRDTVFQKLAAAIPMPIEDIRKKTPRKASITIDRNKKTRFPYETIASIAERSTNSPASPGTNKPIRTYLETGIFPPYHRIRRRHHAGGLQVLYNKGYKTGNVIGKTGIEKQYDSLLRGKNGTQSSTVDVKGKSIDSGSIIKEEPELGKNLVLTIDRNIQILCEKALENARSGRGPKAGYRLKCSRCFLS